MRTPPALLLVSLLTSACGSNSCNNPYASQGCAHWGDETPTSSAPPTKTLAGDDAVEFVTTDEGTFAVASIHSTARSATYAKRMRGRDV